MAMFDSVCRRFPVGGWATLGRWLDIIIAHVT
jgi:hypothetical protein